MAPSLAERPLPKANSRRIAARVLLRVVEQGQSLTEALASELTALPSAQDRAFAQALCYGVMRWYWRLDAILRQLVHKPIQVPEVRLLALIGLQQLAHMAVKPHAAVAETVAATARYPWAKPLLNAVLRNYQRNREALEAAVQTDTSAAYAHPDWLIQRLRVDWPGLWRGILEANNAHPPMTLRINRRKIGRDDYMARLADAGLTATRAPCADGLILERPVDVNALPGFSSGWVSVQDAAAQNAAPLLALEPGQRVLDACAAPGGKTAHILEHCPDLSGLVAVDADGARAGRIRETLERLQLVAAVAVGDARQPLTWWDGRPFDRILLDAPCSATGVIRRHPDIKWLRRPDDIARFAAQQAEILDALWPTLAPGGRLLYVTCSVFDDENGRQIERFCARHADALRVDIDGRPECQLLPDADHDGFYYALLAKRV